MKVMFDEILDEAIAIVAEYECLDYEFIAETWSADKILREARYINRKREKRMDSVRDCWTL